MLTRAIGLVLIMIGLEMGVPIILPLLTGALALAWYVLKLATTVAVVYLGYRLLRQPPLPAI